MPNNTSPTGLTCPKCKNQTDFTITGGIILYGPIHVTEDGWDWSDGEHDAEYSDTSRIQCNNCHFAGSESDF